MKTLVWLNPTSLSTDVQLPHPICWQSCRLEATNLKSHATASCVAVGITIDRITDSLFTMDSSAGTAVQSQIGFVVTDDSTVSTSDNHIILNDDTSEPLHRLAITVTGYGGSGISPAADQFILLNFE